jgi:hypothetical protein
VTDLQGLTLETIVLSRYPSFLRRHAYWSVFSRPGTTIDGVTRLVRGWDLDLRTLTERGPEKHAPSRDA